MYIFRNMHQIELINNNTIRLTLDYLKGNHSKFQFRMLANHAKDLSIAKIKHEISEKSEVYYFEVPNEYVSISKVQQLNFDECRKILCGIFDAIYTAEQYNLHLSNFVIHPEYIFVDDKYNIKFIYVPILPNESIQPNEFVRILLLSLSGSDFKIYPFIFSALLNMTCEEPEVFITAKSIISNYVDVSKFVSERKDYNRFLTFLKKMFTGNQKQFEKQKTTLISVDRENQISYSCKFIDDKSAEIHILEGDSIMGRENTCEIRINHPLISRKHLAIHEKNNIVQIKDLDSSNGTYLNGEKITPNRWYILKEMDTLELADYKLWFNRIS